MRRDERGGRRRAESSLTVPMAVSGGEGRG